MRFDNFNGDFKQVPGAKGYYVNEVGVLVSTKLGTPKEIKFFANVDGYMITGIQNNEGKKIKIRRARIVALTWIPNDLPKLRNVVCHNDGTRTNDSVGNLHWGTQAENMQEAVAHGTIWPGGVRKFSNDDVVAIRYAHDNGASILGLSKEYNVDRATIRNCVKNVTYQDVA